MGWADKFRGGRQGDPEDTPIDPDDGQDICPLTNGTTCPSDPAEQARCPGC